MRRLFKPCLPVFVVPLLLLGGCLGGDGDSVETLRPITGVEWVVSPRQHSVRGDTLFVSGYDTTYGCSLGSPVREIREFRDTLTFQVAQDSLIVVGGPYARRGLPLDSLPTSLAREHYVRLGSGEGLHGRWKLAAVDAVRPQYWLDSLGLSVDTALFQLLVRITADRHLHYHDLEIEISAAGFSERMDHRTADQDLDDWNGRRWGRDVPTLFDSLIYAISVTKVDAYTLRYAGGVTGEVVTVRKLPDGSGRRLSNRSGRGPYGWKSRRTPDCNAEGDPYGFDEFLSENFRPGPGKRAAP